MLFFWTKNFGFWPENPFFLYGTEFFSMGRLQPSSLAPFRRWARPNRSLRYRVTSVFVRLSPFHAKKSGLVPLCASNSPSALSAGWINFPEGNHLFQSYLHTFNIVQLTHTKFQVCEDHFENLWFPPDHPSDKMGVSTNQNLFHLEFFWQIFLQIHDCLVIH